MSLKPKVQFSLTMMGTMSTEVLCLPMMKTESVSGLQVEMMDRRKVIHSWWKVVGDMAPIYKQGVIRCMLEFWFTTVSATHQPRSFTKANSALTKFMTPTSLWFHGGLNAPVYAMTEQRQDLLQVICMLFKCTCNGLQGNESIEWNINIKLFTSFSKILLQWKG